MSLQKLQVFWRADLMGPSAQASAEQEEIVETQPQWDLMQEAWGATRVKDINFIGWRLGVMCMNFCSET